MSGDQILAFVLSRPFISFRAHVVGGRSIDVRHPDYVTPSGGAGGLWLLRDNGHVEAIAGEVIISIDTLEIVDPHTLTG